MAEVGSLAYDAGLHAPAPLTRAIAVAVAESGLNSDAKGDVGLQTDKWGPSVGLWQIRSLKAEKGRGTTRDETKLRDPAGNAKAMVEISKNGTDWGPWSVTHPTSLVGFAAYTAALGPASAIATGVITRKGGEVVAGGAADSAGSLADGVGGVVSDAVQTPVRIVNWLTEPGTMMRVVYLLGGLVLVVAGAVGVMGKPIVSTLLPVGKAAKLVKGK